MVVESAPVRVAFEGPALADFDGYDATELSFRQGDHLIVLAISAPDGWYMARKTAGGGGEGLIPITYVQPGLPVLAPPKVLVKEYDPFRAATIEQRKASGMGVSTTVFEEPAEPPLMLVVEAEERHRCWCRCPFGAASAGVGGDDGGGGRGV